MSLLKEIQDAAVDSSADLSMLLRKCRILASRLNHVELKNWVQHELDGYPDEATLPAYRVLAVQSKGHFVGAYGREARNAPIPSGIFGEKVRPLLATTQMRDSVSSLADLLRGDAVLFREEWPADVLPHFHGKIYEGMMLAQAWKEMSRGAVLGILETIRSRVLNFALEIESANAGAGDAMPGTEPIPQKVVTQIFTTNITGNVGNFAPGSSHFKQRADFQIAAGDAKQLRQIVESLGLSSEDAAELEEAIHADPPLVAKQPFGKAVGAWMGKALSRAAQGMLKVSTEVAAETLSRTIKDFCGLDPGA
jgi:hypothetical protein